MTEKPWPSLRKSWVAGVLCVIACTAAVIALVVLRQHSGDLGLPPAVVERDSQSGAQSPSPLGPTSRRAHDGSRRSESALSKPAPQKLEPADHDQALSLLRLLVSNKTRALEDFYDQQVGPMTEKRGYDEAYKILLLEKYEAFLLAVEAGRYSLDEDLQRTDWPPHLAHMRVACTACAKPGKVSELVLLIDKSKFGLDNVEAFVAERRKIWLQRIVADFNALSLSDRRAKLDRLNKQKAEDKEWRAKEFPGGLAVDHQAASVRVR